MKQLGGAGKGSHLKRGGSAPEATLLLTDIVMAVARALVDPRLRLE